MRTQLVILVLVSLASLDLAKIYQPQAPRPCGLGDYSFTDLAINCTTQLITITDVGTLTALRVGVIIEHPVTPDLYITLIPPSKLHSGSLSKDYWREQRSDVILKFNAQLLQSTRQAFRDNKRYIAIMTDCASHFKSTI